MIRILTAILTLTLMLSGTRAQAITFGNIGISPGPKVAGRVDDDLHYRLAAPSKLQDSVTVVNNDRTSRRLKVTAENAAIGLDNSFSCSPLARGETAGWITLEQKEVEVPADSQEQVTFTINVPAIAAAGEHNACLIVVPVSTDTKPIAGNGIQLQTAVALRVAINIPGNLDWSLHTGQTHITVLDNSVSLIVPQINISPISLYSESLLISLRARSTSINHPVNSVDTLILPHATADIQLTNLPRPVWGGWFKAAYSVAYRPSVSDLSISNQTKTLTGTVNYFIWPKPVAIIGLMSALLLIITGVSFMRKYKNRHNYKLRRSK